MLLNRLTCVISYWGCIRRLAVNHFCHRISPYLYLTMMSIVIHDHQRDDLYRNPVAGNDIFRSGSENRTNTLSSPNSVVFIKSPVQSSRPSLYHPCCTLVNVSTCDQLLMPLICPFSILDLQTHRLHSFQEMLPYHLDQTSSGASCANNLVSSSSCLSQPCRPIQLFIKLIRNTTISIHIDSTSSISDLKHLIYVHDGIPPCDLRLMHRGRELRDDALLSGLDGGTITCLLRVLGGNPYDRIPLYWWFGFSRSYEDGRAGEEGRTCHVLSEIEFEGADLPANWYSNLPLSDWGGIDLDSGIALIDRLYISR